MSYERDNISRLSGYVPGEQPGMDSGCRIIKLNTNENPYPPAKEVLRAVQLVTGGQLRRYPDPRADHFRQVAARMHGLTADQVIATNGGDELLRLAITVFCDPCGKTGGHGGGGVGFAEPSYSLYPVLAGIHDAQVTRVPMADCFSLPKDLAERLNDAGCRLALVVNPHAPSGRLEPLEKLEGLARDFRGVLLVDEAYVDFASSDALGLLSSCRALDNVLLLRTLSKGYSLAGLRFGYGLGHAGLIEALDKARDSYNTDVVSQKAAEAALLAGSAASETWRAVVQERSRMVVELESRGFAVYPSESNFLLVVPPVEAKGLYERLAGRGIYVRYFDQERLRDKLRVTIGMPEENDMLLSALDGLVAGQDDRIEAKL